MLRKVELENEPLQAEIRWLKSYNNAMGSSKAKAKEESARLKLEFEHIRVDLTKKNELEMAYQQVDDMFFYGYCFCMKKHDITDDILSIPSNDENEALLGQGVRQGDGLAMGEGSTIANTDALDTH